MRLGATHPDWALGFEDETWFSRRAHPSVHAWADGGSSLASGGAIGSQG
jgi:hypothetical protein